MSMNCESCRGTVFRPHLSGQSHAYIDDNGKQCVFAYSLMQCRCCGLGFIVPKPSWAILQTFYPSDYGCYCSETAVPPSDPAILKYKVAQWRHALHRSKNFRRFAEAAVGWVAETVSGKTVSYTLGVPLNRPRNCQILEVGYGSGDWLLSMAMLGYSQLHGYDIDANKGAKERLCKAGVKVYSGQLEELQLPGNAFDVIRLEHVFEHLLEPIQILSELHRLLKPGGVLVMNFPSISSPSFSFSPQNAAHRDSPRHLYLHTRRSAQTMLMSAGFKAVKARQYAVVLVLQATINNWLKSRSLKWTLTRLCLFAPLYRVYCAMTRQGEFITVLAVK